MRPTMTAPPDPSSGSSGPVPMARAITRRSATARTNATITITPALSQSQAVRPCARTAFSVAAASSMPGLYPLLLPGEPRRPLLHEGDHRLHEVVRLQERRVPDRDVVEPLGYRAALARPQHRLGALHHQR